jgi:UDP-N-acetylmuramoyl-tripeptide--D-alanyl-D-alanine ligase
MIPVRLAELRSPTLVHGSPELAISGLVADSRLAQPGSLFVCLEGSRSDGHDFIEDAVRRGAAAVLCTPGRGPRTAAASLESAEPLASLAEIGRLVRRRSRAHLIGVAGSAGKTTLKDVLHALLAPHLATVASRASHNNELGVPLTLAQLEPDTAACVCELGTGAPGELAALCATAQPDVGVLTAIGPEHLEFFGDVTSVAAEEAALIAALPPGRPSCFPSGSRCSTRTSATTSRNGASASTRAPTCTCSTGAPAPPPPRSPSPCVASGSSSRPTCVCLTTAFPSLPRRPCTRPSACRLRA